MPESSIFKTSINIKELKFQDKLNSERNPFHHVQLLQENGNINSSFNKANFHEFKKWIFNNRKIKLSQLVPDIVEEIKGLQQLSHDEIRNNQLNSNKQFINHDMEKPSIQHETDKVEDFAYDQFSSTRSLYCYFCFELVSNSHYVNIDGQSNRLECRSCNVIAHLDCNNTSQNKSSNSCFRPVFSSIWHCPECQSEVTVTNKYYNQKYEIQLTEYIRLQATLLLQRFIRMILKMRKYVKAKRGIIAFQRALRHLFARKRIELLNLKKLRPIRIRINSIKGIYFLKSVLNDVVSGKFNKKAKNANSLLTSSAMTNSNESLSGISEGLMKFEPFPIDWPQVSTNHGLIKSSVFETVFGSGSCVNSAPNVNFSSIVLDKSKDVKIRYSLKTNAAMVTNNCSTPKSPSFTTRNSSKSKVKGFFSSQAVQSIKSVENKDNVKIRRNNKSIESQSHSTLPTLVDILKSGHAFQPNYAQTSRSFQVMQANQIMLTVILYDNPDLDNNNPSVNQSNAVDSNLNKTANPRGKLLKYEANSSGANTGSVDQANIRLNQLYRVDIPLRVQLAHQQSPNGIGNIFNESILQSLGVDVNKLSVDAKNKLLLEYALVDLIPMKSYILFPG